MQTFTLSLPVVAPSESTAEPIEQVEEINSGLPTLLIVDDEPSITEILTAFLEDDFEITSTNFPEEAIKFIGKNNYSAILTDMRMPKYSGIQVTEAAAER